MVSWFIFHYISFSLSLSLCTRIRSSGLKNTPLHLSRCAIKLVSPTLDTFDWRTSSPQWDLSHETVIHFEYIFISFYSTGVLMSSCPRMNDLKQLELELQGEYRIKRIMRGKWCLKKLCMQSKETSRKARKDQEKHHEKTMRKERKEMKVNCFSFRDRKWLVIELRTAWEHESTRVWDKVDWMCQLKK